YQRVAHEATLHPHHHRRAARVTPARRGHHARGPELPSVTLRPLTRGRRPQSLRRSGPGRLQGRPRPAGHGPTGPSPASMRPRGSRRSFFRLTPRRYVAYLRNIPVFLPLSDTAVFRVS